MSLTRLLLRLEMRQLELRVRATAPNQRATVQFDPKCCGSMARLNGKVTKPP